MTGLQAFVESRGFTRFIVAVIVLNAITLGMETSPAMMERMGGLLLFIDGAALIIYTIELTLKFIVYRLSFFKQRLEPF